MTLVETMWGRRSRLDESFKDAQRKFVDEGGSPSEVKAALDSFKVARDAKRLKTEESDIGAWISQGWEAFNKFAASLNSRTTKRQVKKQVGAEARKDVIVHRDDDDVLILTPLTEEASCYFGKGTKWCTSATKSKNHFNDYINKGKILFYVIERGSTDKRAAVWNVGNDKWKYYDEEDEEVVESDFPYVLQQYANQEVVNLVVKARELWWQEIREGKRKDLARVNLSDADLSGFDLTGADLTGANLARANLTDADLNGAILRGSVLSLAELTRAVLKNAKLEGVNVWGAVLVDVDLEGANLKGAWIEEADLSGANLKGANLEGADLTGATMPENWEKVAMGKPNFLPDGSRGGEG